MESRSKDSTREHITRVTVFFGAERKKIKNVQFVTSVWHEMGEI